MLRPNLSLRLAGRRPARPGRRPGAPSGGLGSARNGQDSENGRLTAESTRTAAADCDSGESRGVGNAGDLETRKAAPQTRAHACPDGRRNWAERALLSRGGRGRGSRTDARIARSIAPRRAGPDGTGPAMSQAKRGRPEGTERHDGCCAAAASQACSTPVAGARHDGRDRAARRLLRGGRKPSL